MLKAKKVVKFVDEISIISLAFTSFPESFLLIILGILAIGRFSYLKKKTNFIRIGVYAVVMSVLDYFTRRVISSPIENLLISLFASSLLCVFIMRLKFYESIMATLFGMVVVVSIQTAVLLILTAILKINLSHVYASDLLRILMTLPERTIQIVLVIFAYRRRIKIVDMESTTIKKKEYFIQLSVYIISIGTLIFLALVMAKILLFDHSNFTNATNTLLLRLNIYLSLFVTVILTLAIKNTHEFYKKKNTLNNNEFMQNLEYISSLIDEKNFNEAKGAVDSLKDHITKQ